MKYAVGQRVRYVGHGGQYNVFKKEYVGRVFVISKIREGPTKQHVRIDASHMGGPDGYGVLLENIEPVACSAFEQDLMDWVAAEKRELGL